MHFRFSRLIALPFAMFGAAHAADKPRVAPPESWVAAPLVAGAPAAGASSAAAAVLAADVQMRFDGKGSTRFSEYQVKIQTPEGLTAFGTVTSAWSSATDVVTFHRLNIIRGGVVIDCLPKDGVFNVIRRESKLESQATLDDVLTTVLRPEGLQVGDILDVALTLRRDDPLLVGAFDDSVEAFDAAPLANLRIKAIWPDQAAVKWQVSEGFGPAKVTRAGGETTVAIESHDLQPLIPPHGAPARYQHGRTFQVSNYAQWSDVAAKLQPLYAAAATIQPGGALAGEVKAIAARTTDPKARTLAALMLVEDKVHYFEQAIGDGGLNPSPADLTWTRRWGDCKAKTVLLIAMLKSLGVEAEPVYVSVARGDGVGDRLPSLGVFDHVVTRATIAGHVLWLDGTRVGDTSLAALNTPNFGWVLPVRPRNAVLMRLLPEPFDRPQEVNQLDLDASAGLDVPAKAHGQMVTRGDAAKLLHTATGNLTESALQAALRAFWVGRYDFVTPTTMSAKYDAEAGEETLTMDGTAKLDWSGGYEADGARVGFKFDVHRDPGPNADAPFQLAYPSFEASEQTIILPNGGAGFTVEGDNVDRDLAGFHFHRKAEIVGGAFHLEASTHAMQPELSAAEMQKAVEPLAALGKTMIHVKAPAGYRRTLADLAALAATEPTTSDEYATRASAFLEAERLREAIRDEDKAIQLAPANGERLALRGLFYAWRRDNALATADLDQAEKLGAKTATIYRARGLVAENEKRWPDAVSAYQKALSLESKDDFALQHLAQTYESSKDFTLAIQTSDRYFDLFPDETRRHVRRAKIYVEMNDLPKARQEVAASPLDVKTDADRALLRIEILKQIGDKEGALAAATRLIATAPTAEAYLMRASLAPDQDYAKALTDVMTAARLDPKSVPALTSAARLEIKLKHYPQAETWLNKAVAVAPQDVALLYVKADLDVKSAAPVDQTKADFAKIRERAAGDAAALNSVCYTEATDGFDLTQALADCDASLKLDPANSAVLDSRGFVLLRMDRNADAVKAYDEALSEWPIADSFFGRSLAEARTQAGAAAERDRATAVAMSPNIAKTFEGYGVTR